MTTGTASECRLCGGETSVAFRAPLLGRDTGYHRCRRCGGLQTDQPDWLDEAYSGGHLSGRDTGAVERCLRAQAFVFVVARVLGLPRDSTILDFGGGSGLLCRLLRDQGFDAYIEDEHSNIELAKAYAATVEDGPFDIITAFEVAEHLSHPGKVFKRLLSARPRVLLIATETYRGQGADWHYLAPSDGQHIFFYAPESMQYIAETGGYHYLRFGDLHLLTMEPLGKLRRRVLRRLLRQASLRWVRAVIAFRSSFAFAARDLAQLDANEPKLR